MPPPTTATPPRGRPTAPPSGWHALAATQLLLALVVLAVQALAEDAALASATRLAGSTPAAPLGPVELTHHPSLATRLSVEVVPEALQEHSGASEPTHLLVSFEGYPEAGDYPLPAEIRVFPATAYARTNPFAAGTIAALRTLIAEHPDLRQRYPAYLPVDGLAGVAQHLPPWESSPPFLPWSGMATVVTAQPAYLDGSGVSGIRYLAQHAHNHCWTGTRDITFYTFQGLAAGGEAYVSARFPVRTPFPIPPFEPPDPWSPAAYATTCDAANASLAAALDLSPRDAFAPSIDLLDTLITSLRVAPPADTP